MNSERTEKKGRKVSINLDNLSDIQPIVYSFKIPPNSHTSGSVLTAARPPQWLYHDHVMGVIWMIFHKDKNYVGISQLQWCLRFLLDLKNSQGEFTGDVEICIQAIQDNLIEQYAKLGPALEKTINQKPNKEARDNNFTNDLTLEANESNQLLNTNITDSTNNNNNEEDKEEKKDNDLSTPQIKDIQGTSTPQRKDSESWKYEKKQIIKESKKNCGAECATIDADKKKEEMLSFTYDEMISRGPAPCKKSYLIKDACSKQQLVEHIEKDKVNLTNLNSNDLVNFLNTSRLQHVERINKEKQTLRILEQFMENLNMSDLSPNNIENLKKSLANVQSQNLIKKAEEINKT